MPYNIDISRAVSEVGEKTQLVITLSNPVGFDDAKLFLAVALPITAAGQEQRAKFYGVCSVSDLEDYPPDAPQLNANPAFFRLATYTMLFDNQGQRETIYALIRQELLDLIALRTELDDVGSPDTETLG